jgi:single stranded DNA-binding protein
MRLAVNRPYQGKSAAQKKTDYFDVITFGKLGQTVFQHLKKGSLCTLLGRVEQSEFATQYGDRREKYTIVANKVTIHDWQETVTERLDREANEDLLVPREITQSLQGRLVDLSDEDMPEEFLI